MGIPRNQFPRIRCTFPGTIHLHSQECGVHSQECGVYSQESCSFPGMRCVFPGINSLELLCQESDCRSLFEEWMRLTNRWVTTPWVVPRLRLPSLPSTRVLRGVGWGGVGGLLGWDGMGVGVGWGGVWEWVSAVACFAGGGGVVVWLGRSHCVLRLTLSDSRDCAYNGGNAFTLPGSQDLDIDSWESFTLVSVLHFPGFLWIPRNDSLPGLHVTGLLKCANCWEFAQKFPAIPYSQYCI